MTTCIGWGTFCIVFHIHPEVLVDSDLQRENILPSERAKAYKMKMDAIRRPAGRPAKNSVQVGQNFDGKTSREILAENSPDSATQIQRYIRLTELQPALLSMVDEGKIGSTPCGGVVLPKARGTAKDFQGVAAHPGTRRNLEPRL